MTTKIYLSSRGWGDYSPVEWAGDLSKSDAEIIAECRAMLDRANDVDTPLSNEQIAAKVAEARAKVAGQQTAKQTEVDRIAQLQATAKETGNPQIVRKWMTNRCMNGSVDCSFDSAVETIDGNGNRRTKYTCCY